MKTRQLWGRPPTTINPLYLSQMPSVIHRSPDLQDIHRLPKLEIYTTRILGQQLQDSLEAHILAKDQEVIPHII